MMKLFPAFALDIPIVAKASSTKRIDFKKCIRFIVSKLLVKYGLKTCHRCEVGVEMGETNGLLIGVANAGLTI
jgi:hypothetical protein